MTEKKSSSGLKMFDDSLALNTNCRPRNEQAGQALPDMNQPFVVGSVETAVGKVPCVSSTLVRADRLGGYKARWGIGRMHYMVQPGLYALGEPDDKAPVFVTANYKMSFDCLREALKNRHAWLLALDTAGINVWCAAGKGTFGTLELARHIASSGLAGIISHRKLILPQLSASGVSAHQVKNLTGFEVTYGPIRAKDLPAFLDNGLKALPGMRLKTFSTLERLVLIPVELVSALKVSAILLAVLLLLSALLGPEGFWQNIMSRGIIALPAIMTAVLAGAVMTPLLLPWLPGRAFSVKGLPLGIAGALILLVFRLGALATWGERLEMIGWLLIVPAATTYLSMNFTGASTYTSLSGVKKEMRLGLPFQIGASVAGLAFWFWSFFVA